MADIPQLAILRKQQLLDEGSSPDSNIDSELTDYLASGLAYESFVSWLAVDSGRIVATSGVCFYRLPPNYSNPSGWVAYVTSMFTVKEYRRQGIATELLRLVIDEAKRRGYSVVRLHASSDGKTVYGRQGFIDTDGYMELRI